MLRYLKVSQDQGLIFKQSGKPLIAFVDIDWASNIYARKPHPGYTFVLSGTAITWESWKQHNVPLSLTESEYITLIEADKETVYLGLFQHGLCYNT